MSYKRLDPEDIVVSAESIAAPAWTGNTVTLSDLFSNSTQRSNTSGEFYLNLYDKVVTDDSSEVQFAIAYGNSKGSGSRAFNTAVVGNSPSSTVYKQARTQLLGTEESLFKINDTDAESVYVVSLNRSRYKEKLLPGSLTIKISGSQFTDDSLNTTVDSFSDTGRVYNLVSGSAGNPRTEKYGLVYPDAGIIIVSSSLAPETDQGSTVANGNNNDYFLNVLKEGGVEFTVRSEETVTSNYVFIRARNSEFNYSTNPSYITGSGELRHSTLIDNPQAYISTVGLYNDNNELLAVAKLSRPLLKDFTKEALLRVKLDY